MMHGRKDIDDEERGIESYHIKRQQAVERALEKARHALPVPWKELTQHDLEVLDWTFGQVWSFTKRPEWDDIAFSGMTLAALVKIIQIGDQVMHGEKEGRSGFEEVYGLLSRLK